MADLKQMNLRPPYAVLPTDSRDAEVFLDMYKPENLGMINIAPSWRSKFVATSEEGSYGRCLSDLFFQTSIVVLIAGVFIIPVFDLISTSSPLASIQTASICILGFAVGLVLLNLVCQLLSTFARKRGREHVIPATLNGCPLQLRDVIAEVAAYTAVLVVFVGAKMDT